MDENERQAKLRVSAKHAANHAAEQELARRRRVHAARSIEEIEAQRAARRIERIEQVKRWSGWTALAIGLAVAIAIIVAMARGR